MRLQLPQLDPKGTLVAFVASVMFIGSAAGSYGPSVAYDLPPWLYLHPLFPILLVGFGILGLVLYLTKALFNQLSKKLAFRILAPIPFLIMLVMFALTSSPMILAWSIVTAVFATHAIANKDISLPAARSTLVPYASSFLVVMGLLMVILGITYAPIRLERLVGLIALVAGVVGWIGFVKGSTKAETVVRYVLALALAGIAVFAFRQGHPLMHILVTAPLAGVLAMYPTIKKMRFGQWSVPKGISEKDARVWQFQDITEINAWVIYAFGLIYIVTTPEISGHVFFALFVIGSLFLSYQYRVQSARRMTPKDYTRHSFLNLILLTIISFFTEGVFSIFNWFFLIALMSVMAVGGRRHLNLKLAWLTVFYVFAGTWAVWQHAASVPLVFDTVLIQYVVILTAALYIRRITGLQEKIDADLRNRNKELSDALGREVEAKQTIIDQAEDLKRAQTQLQTVVGSATDGIVAVDSDGKIVFANPASVNIMRCRGLEKAQDTVGLDIGDVLPLKNEDEDTPDVLESIKTVLRGARGEASAVRRGAQDDDSVLIPFPQGSYFQCGGNKKYVEGVATDLGKDAGGDIRMVITFSDITYRREVEHLKTDFMSIAAHQLRTPLSSIRWFLELLNDPDEGRLNKNQKMFAKNAYLSIRRMISLVGGLLAVTRVEASRVPSRPQPVSIVDLTNEIVDTLKKEVRDKKIKVRINTEGKIPQINLDPHLSREVFMNLLDNAVRYSQESGEILIFISDEGDAVSWSVHDNGIGIPQDQQERIFDKFYRATNAAQHESEGTGLGLYLAKYIANQWGGDITFESEEGAGTTFRVTVPKTGMSEKKGEVSLHA